MKYLPVVAVLLVLLPADIAWGQAVAGGAVGRGMEMGAFGGGMGGYWGYGGGHASTIAEGYQRGMADVVRSAGAANLMDSQAAQNYQSARSQYLDNTLKSTETFFENRKMAKAYKEAERGPGLSREAMYRMAKDAAPQRLSPGEYDPVTGELVFPLILQDPVYADACNKLQELFKSRQESGGGLGLATYRQIEDTTNALTKQLAGRIREYSPGDYAEAKNFLRSLSHEARFAAG
jgi:hypothetical protein